ncbi:EAL domain-containing protein [Neptunomonas antarctica]|uniref:EAL domain-containing protein n=1 Tax=Neptunomonas antarctica TaxID=619304 RepID=UPI00138ECDA1|nr:EAL domain-containing protein [Neptunomonas antarctica]
MLICLLPVCVAASQQLETVTLQLKYYHQFQFAGYYAALEKGFYKEAGLDVKINAHAPGLKSSIDEVLSGTTEYGIADSSLVMERLAGKPVVVLADIFQKSPSAWIVREDSGISGVHDFAGKRVMYNPGSTSELLAMLQVEGIPANKVNLTPASFNIQDLVGGHIDAFNGYLTNEPYLLQEQGVPYRIISPINYGIESYGDVLFTTESEIENHPERAKAFLAASLKGWGYAMEHSDEIIDLIRTKYNLTKSVSHLKFEAEAMRSLILPDLVEIGHINPGRWRVIAQNFVALGSTDVDYDLLNGFIFDPTPNPHDHRKIYAVIAAAVSLALVFLGLAIWVGRLNTRLKTSEQHIREREENLNEAQKIAHLASWDWDVSSNEVTWSDELYRMFGLEPGEIPPVYDYYLNAINPDDHAHTLKALKKALANEGDYDVEYRLIRKNGEECIVHSQAIIKRDSEGKPVRMIGTSHDITDRRQTEAALQKSEQKLRYLFDHMTEGFMLCDIICDEKGIPCDYRILEANTASDAQLGMDASTMVGKTVLDVYPDVEQCWIEIYGEIALTKKPRSFTNYNHNTGRHYETSAFATENGQFAMLFKDVTLRKQAEEALREAEERLRLLVNQADLHLWSIDKDLKFTQSLGGGLVSLNMSPNEVVGQTLYQFLQTESPESLPIKAHLLALEGKQNNYESEWQGRHYQAQVTPQYDTNDQVVGCIGLAVDITYRKHADESLRREAVIFDNTDEGIMVTDAEGNIIRVNKAFTVISGYKSDEVVGKHPKLQQSGRHDKTFYKKMWDSISQNGQWRGEIWNQRKNGDIYPAWENITMVKDEQGRLTHYVAIFSDISVLKASEERFSHLAHHDSLTELPNRLRFRANLEQAIEGAKRHKHKIALLYLDLDGFKHINDTLGHAIGDEYLKKMAERLKKCVRAEDTVARIGGDEFTIVLTEVAHAGAAGLITEKIVQAVRQPITVNTATIDPSASIGICMYPDDAMDTDGMVKAADAAMYHAKAMGKNCYRFYTADLNSHMIERVLIEQGLRSAFEHEEFELLYQPQVSLANGKITGIEALIRWNHPERGLLLPGKFIGIADDMSLIDKISQWVLRTTISDYEQWFKNTSTQPRIAINITGRQISNEESIKQLLNILDELVSAENTIQFDFEITESSLERIEDTIDVINTLKQRGIIFSIDDFGTGHSSLSRLKQFPIDSLKIDQSFVSNLADDGDDKSIVSAIIAMAHSLNLSVIAEGVENQRQLDVLRALGCDEIQGFYFSKPVPASEIALLLEKTYR